MSHKLGDLFVKNVKDRLHALSWKQADLARALKITPQSVNKLLSAINNPSFETVETVAKILGTTPLCLLATPEERQKLEDPSLSILASTQFEALGKRLEALESKTNSAPRPSSRKERLHLLVERLLEQDEEEAVLALTALLVNPVVATKTPDKKKSV